MSTGLDLVFVQWIARQEDSETADQNLVLLLFSSGESAGRYLATDESSRVSLSSDPYSVSPALCGNQSGQMEVANMATTSSNGTRQGRSSRDLSKADATKLNASELPKLVVGYRDDKVTPSRAVNALNRKVVTILDAPGMSPDERVAAIEAAKQAAIADAIASIERAAQRANVPPVSHVVPPVKVFTGTMSVPNSSVLAVVRTLPPTTARLWPRLRPNPQTSGGAASAGPVTSFHPVDFVAVNGCKVLSVIVHKGGVIMDKITRQEALKLMLESNEVLHCSVCEAYNGKDRTITGRIGVSKHFKTQMDLALGIDLANEVSCKGVTVRANPNGGYRSIDLRTLHTLSISGSKYLWYRTYGWVHITQHSNADILLTSYPRLVTGRSVNSESVISFPCLGRSVCTKIFPSLVRVHERLVSYE